MMWIDDDCWVMETCFDVSSGAALQSAEEGLDSWMTVVADFASVTWADD